MQPLAQLETIAIGQHHVQHDDIERLLLEQLPHARSVLGSTYLKLMTTQIHRQRVADLAMVIDDQNAGRGPGEGDSSVHRETWGSYGK
ncbi:putative uncharacterized protein [Pseudomonas sp. StFLB209]|nr:putative uncharacterized protein [Pseudomonas sp. StFLB209]